MRINNISNVSNSSLKPITNKSKQTNESSFSEALNTLNTNAPSKTNVSKTLLKPITNKPTQTNKSSFGKALNALDTNVPSKTNVSKTLDFTNMSELEFNQIVGKDIGSYIILPEGGWDVISSGGLLPLEPDRKINFIEHFRQQAEVNKGQPYFTNALRIMESLQGKSTSVLS
jgi:hypothetical protein